MSHPFRNFVIASEAKQSMARHTRRDGLLRGACHRARIRATRWLAMTAETVGLTPLHLQPAIQRRGRRRTNALGRRRRTRRGGLAIPEIDHDDQALDVAVAVRLQEFVVAFDRDA